MDKVLVFGTKDCRFESCQGHLMTARLAQSAERKALNLVVVGSIKPHGGCFLRAVSFVFFLNVFVGGRASRRRLGAQAGGQVV